MVTCVVCGNYSTIASQQGLNSWLVASLSTRRSGFDPRLVLVWILVAKVALWQIFSAVRIVPQGHNIPCTCITWAGDLCCHRQAFKYRGYVCVCVCVCVSFVAKEHIQGASLHNDDSWQLALHESFSHLNTNRRPLYLKTQSVPRCKHFSSRL
jgi:hypothetical protein